MSEAIEVREVRPVESTTAALMPAMTIDQMVARYNALVEATRKVLRADVDYGRVAGKGSKPTLLKPGAEKLAALFGLRPRFEILEKIEDWDAGFFYYLYRCRLYRNGEIVAEGDGSANSREKKHRWRMVPEWEVTPDLGEPARWEARTSKGGKPYKVAIYENREPYDLVNTLQKMAQKRALVAAVLIATGASEFFTQDLEDLAYGPEGGNGNGHTQASQQATRQERQKGGDTPGHVVAVNAFMSQDLGIKDRELKLDLISAVLDRPVESTNDLGPTDVATIRRKLARLKDAFKRNNVGNGQREAYVRWALGNGIEHITHDPDKGIEQWRAETGEQELPLGDDA